MENKDSRFSVLIGKRLFSRADAKDYTDWAEQLLHEDVASDNVAILASFGMDKYPDPIEIEEYFQKSLKDLGITLPNRKQGLLEYSKDICKGIIDGSIDPLLGEKKLYEICVDQEYDLPHLIWLYLDDDIDFLGDGESAQFNAGLTRHNLPEYITKLAIQFIAMADFDLPDNFFELYACKQCKHISPLTESYKQKISGITGKLKTILGSSDEVHRYRCVNCSADNPVTMHDFEAREIYLNSRK